MEEKTTLLEMRNITKIFPGVKALDDVSFDLRPGEVHILLGENGAGKSTLMKVLAGSYTPDSGELYIEGKRVEKFSPIHAQSLGVGIIYQEFNLVPYLSVAENIFIDNFPRSKFGRLNHRKMHEEADKLLQSMDMHVNTHANANEIPVAQQQMVEVAKALTHDLKILIMDEPTSSLSDREIEQLFKVIRGLKEKGIGIIYISHRLAEIPVIGDRITILRDGKYVGTRDVHEITMDEMVRMMVGREVQDIYHRDYQKPRKVALRVEHLTSNTTGLKDVTLEVREGEIVGLSGLVGAGRTETARAVFHIDQYDSGKIELLGEEIPKSMSTKELIKRGLSLIPEDRKRQGLSLILSVSDNVEMASLDEIYPRMITSKAKDNEVVGSYVDELKIATPSIRQKANNLSGGNQQKVVLAKWLCTNAKVIIFDEPTRGIDIGAKCEIYALMNQFAAEGRAVLMISSELPEIVGVSDRVYVMRDGEVVAELDRTEASQETIVAYAMGSKKMEGTE